MSEYTDLLARREALRLAWLEQVDMAKSLGIGHDRFNSPGVMLGRAGELYLYGYFDGRRVVEMASYPDGNGLRMIKDWRAAIEAEDWRTTRERA